MEFNFILELPPGAAVFRGRLVTTEEAMHKLIADFKEKLPERRGRPRVPPELRCSCGQLSRWLAEKRGHRC